MELGPGDVSPIRELSTFQRVLCTGFNGVGCVPIREVSSFQRVYVQGSMEWDMKIGPY